MPRGENAQQCQEKFSGLLTRNCTFYVLGVWEGATQPASSCSPKKRIWDWNLKLSASNLKKIRFNKEQNRFRRGIMEVKAGDRRSLEANFKFKLLERRRFSPQAREFLSRGQLKLCSRNFLLFKIVLNSFTYSEDSRRYIRGYLAFLNLVESLGFFCLYPDTVERPPSIFKRFK